jgi:AraC-like DNA-binding protein
METLQKIMVKGMVCGRCINTVSGVLEQAGITTGKVVLGEVQLQGEVAPAELQKVESHLKTFGFSLLKPKTDVVIDEIKKLVSEVYSGDYDFDDRFRFSDLVTKKLQVDYKQASSAFISKQGISLEKYIIGFRIDKIKEALVYSDHTLEDLAFRFGYSSTAHLSSQFRQVTGLTASHFRNIRNQKQLT